MKQFKGIYSWITDISNMYYYVAMKIINVILYGEILSATEGL